MSNWPIQVHWFKWILESPVFNVPQLPTFHDMNCVGFDISQVSHIDLIIWWTFIQKKQIMDFSLGGIWLQSFCFWLFLFYSDKLVFVLLSCLVAQLIDICSWNFHVGEEQLCRTRIHTGTQKTPRSMP